MSTYTNPCTAKGCKNRIYKKTKREPRKPICHPSREHRAKGLCNSCYNVRYVREYRKTRKYRRWWEKNKTKIRARQNKYYNKHKDRAKKYYELNREKIRRRKKIYYKKRRQYFLNCSKIWAQKHYLQKVTRERLYRLNIKKRVIGHYSPKLICKRCGFSDLRVLTIDHIKGDGARHRSNIGKAAGGEFYRWLIKNNFPKGFQILCMNCQWIKRIENDEIYHGRI